ncbi:ABC transporter substrate-binding protein [Rhizobium sp. SSA_523]|uniref:ABC transporter substrate-binding protein n=1 Tax=Rhizobium sp. SSA_523 TaxID=2952477 RepID=UPI002090287F|nr:ABC transporter substrate-binding protein [Rhizobium sp. SSA_523]MCO5731515.1 ABC transporter substrate-binding protein [Rhizobium sp. SSA_523]WKC21969.1 ABC transporter substrate-binding protein [Rhizobium sp. SSA_523]
MIRKFSMALAVMLGACALTGAAKAQEVRLMCSFDLETCDVMRSLLKKYEDKHPDVHIIADGVPYAAVMESLPAQLDSGNGPDMAVITDLGSMNRFYLDLTPYVDAKYWQDNFGPYLTWYRNGPADKGIYGLQMILTVTGPIINRTLFDQANVALPGRDATMDDWAAAARKVAAATGALYPMALDRSGHRFAGPAISHGAKIFAESKPILVDEGFSTFARKFVEWNQDGTMARQVWGGKGGNAFQDAIPEFVNGQLVYYFSGSWQTTVFEHQIGSNFDWEVVPPPCGPATCTGMPGGSGLVGFKHTKHPETVASIINFLAQDDNYAEFIDRTRNVPAHAGVAAKGVDYKGSDPQVQKALKVWTEEARSLSPIAYAYQGYKNNRSMFNITVQRITQAIVGELTIDEALARAKSDLDAALKQAK